MPPMRRLTEGTHTLAAQLIEELGAAEADAARAQWVTWMRATANGGLLAAYVEAMGSVAQQRAHARGHGALVRAVTTLLAEDIGLTQQATTRECMYALMEVDLRLPHERVKELLAALRNLCEAARLAPDVAE